MLQVAAQRERRGRNIFGDDGEMKRKGLGLGVYIRKLQLSPSSLLFSPQGSKTRTVGAIAINLSRKHIKYITKIHERRQQHSYTLPIILNTFSR